MAERSMNGSEGDPRLRGGLDFSQVARHLGFALAAGVVGAAASIVLSIAVDFAGRLSARFAWILLVLPVLGTVLSVLLYRALRLPAHLATDTMVDRLRRNDLVPPSLAPGILAGTVFDGARRRIGGQGGGGAANGRVPWRPRRPSF